MARHCYRYVATARSIGNFDQLRTLAFAKSVRSFCSVSGEDTLGPITIRLSASVSSPSGNRSLRKGVTPYLPERKWHNGIVNSGFA